MTLKGKGTLWYCDIINPSLSPDTVNLVKGARDYTPERVGQFLEGVGLGHHRHAFCDAEVNGDMLLDEAEEMLAELGVTSPTERLKIKVYSVWDRAVGVWPLGSSTLCSIKLPIMIFSNAPNAIDSYPIIPALYEIHYTTQNSCFRVHSSSSHCFLLSENLILLHYSH